MVTLEWNDGGQSLFKGTTTITKLARTTNFVHLSTNTFRILCASVSAIACNGIQVDEFLDDLFCTAALHAYGNTCRIQGQIAHIVFTMFQKDR